MPTKSMRHRSSGSTRLANNAVVHRVLSITEIQDRIFSFNDVGDAARCTRVCRAWMEVGLDHTWHTVHCLYDLFKMLGPMNASAAGCHFTRLLNPSDWDTFYKIARRVRKLDLEFDSKAQRNTNLKETAFWEVLRSSPRTYILPNLVKLHCRIRTNFFWLRFTVIFLGPRLRTLSFRLPAISGENAKGELETFLNEVSSRAPMLKEIDAFPACPIRGMEDVLSEFFPQMMSLEKNFMSSLLLTTPILASVSNLPRLKCLHVDPLEQAGHIDGLLDLSCESSENNFPRIRHLTLQGQVNSISALFLCLRGSFRFLRRFKLDMVHTNDVTDISSFINFLCANCTALCIVEFTRWTYNRWNRQVLDDEPTPWTIDVLSPFQSLVFLHTLSIEHTQPVLATNDDLVEFVIGCRRLVRLQLNPVPKQDKIARFVELIPSIEVLPRILDCRPDMKTLSLFLDASGSDYPYVQRSASSLKSLDLGASIINEPDDAALFLSQFLPVGCTFKVDDPARTEWRTVKKKLPRFLKFRNDERSRISELQDEVHKLKQRIRDLSAQNSMDESLETGYEDDELEDE